MRRTADRAQLRGWLREALQPGDGIVWSQGAAEPTPVLEEVLAVRAAAHGGALFMSIGFGDTVRAEVTDHLRIRGLGGLGSNRRLAAVMEVVPAHLSSLPAAIRRGDIRVDVALVQVSPADAAGRHSLGIDAAYAAAALDAARVAVAEANAQVPRTGGHAPVPAERFDLVLATDRPLPEVPARTPSEVEQRIAGLAAPFVPEGATLQFGIGSTPGALAAALRDRRGLALHTGLLDDAQLGLLRSGAVARGRAVTGTLAGTRRLYAEAAEAGVLVQDVERTHGLAALARLPRFTAVNTAVEVDLTGQVNAEVVGERHVGGVGGLGDFMRGALVSEGGRSLLLLPATASGGHVSRIVRRLHGGTVTVPRSDVDVVVTEHGAAELRGRSLSERAALLRAIAAPEHRAGLAP